MPAHPVLRKSRFAPLDFAACPAEIFAMQNPWPWILLVVVILVVIVLKQRSQIPADDARRLLAEGAQVIDVRSASEFSSGHVSSAVNIPLEVVTERIASVAPDKNTPVLLHCQSGTRSAMACRKLKSAGYTQVLNLGSLSRARSLCAESDEK